jgi:hypothetical protein
MKRLNRISRVVGWLMAVALSAGLALAARVDLSRETPVGPAEQIPIVDFFRPPILWQPKLNLAGTHIAAILNTAEDHTELIVYDMRNQKFDRIGGHGKDDIFTFEWLNSKRLIFSLHAKGGGGSGWIAAEVDALNSAYPVIQLVGSDLIAVPPFASGG